MVHLQHEFRTQEECFLLQPLQPLGLFSSRGLFSTKTEQQRRCTTIGKSQATAVLGALSQGTLTDCIARVDTIVWRIQHKFTDIAAWVSQPGHPSTGLSMK